MEECLYLQIPTETHQRDAVTGWPKTSDKKTTDEICKVVHDSPGFIPIRDKYVKVALQTNDSNLGQ